jgi:hypothetical protein
MIQVVDIVEGEFTGLKPEKNQVCQDLAKAKRYKGNPLPYPDRSPNQCSGRP